MIKLQAFLASLIEICFSSSSWLRDVPKVCDEIDEEDAMSTSSLEEVVDSDNSESEFQSCSS